MKSTTSRSRLVKRADVFPAGAEVIPATAGGRGRPFGSGMIIDRGMADWIGFFLISTHYPRIRGLWCGGAWNDAWVSPQPQALSDQRVAELISLKELLVDDDVYQR